MPVGLLRRARHSHLGNLAFAAANRVALERARLSGRLGIDVAGRMGMGAVLTHLTLALGLSERLGMRPAIRFGNPLYARQRGVDWFPDLFNRCDDAGDTAPPSWLCLRLDLDHRLLGSPVAMTLVEGKAIFERHVRFKPFLHDEADAVLRPIAALAPLGVHYRGTDKHDEAPVVARRAAVAAIKREMAVGGHRGIFLATDEPAFAAELRAALPGLPIVMYERPELTVEPGQPIHFSSGDGYWKGVDALVNMLALARCGSVVRTASYLSGWAKVLNPGQRIVMLNQAYSATRFPDNQIRSSDEAAA